MSEAMVHFLTHHSNADLIVIPVDWLPRNGRHWCLFPDVDALALSPEVWESGQVHAIFAELGIQLRLPNLSERPPARVRCQQCPAPWAIPSVRSATQPPVLPAAPAGYRPTVNDLGLLAPR
jgi:hypothetical protein